MKSKNKLTGATAKQMLKEIHAQNKIMRPQNTTGLNNKRKSTDDAPS